MAQINTNITDYLDSHNFRYEILEHDELAYTSEEAAEFRDVSLDEMIKSMVFLNDNREIILALVQADKKVNLRSLKSEAKINSLKFADEDTIKNELGYQVGAIPPFFPTNSVPIYIDSDIIWNSQVNFSAGIPNAGIEVDIGTFREIMEQFDSTKTPIGTEIE